MPQLKGPLEWIVASYEKFSAAPKGLMWHKIPSHLISSQQEVLMDKSNNIPTFNDLAMLMCRVSVLNAQPQGGGLP